MRRGVRVCARSAWTRALAAGLAAVCCAVTPAAAADDPAVASPQALVPVASEPARVRLFLAFDANLMAAPKTLDAVFGKSTLTALGGGVDVLHVVKRVFARVAITSTHVGGQRAEVFDGVVVPIGIPLQLGLRTLEVGGGWRFRPLAGGRVTAYAGGSLLRVVYEETSSFAQAGDDLRDTLTGAAALAGIEFRLAPWVVVGLEGQFRTVPRALGDGGLSREFGERDLGSRTIRFLLGIAR